MESLWNADKTRLPGSVTFSPPELRLYQRRAVPAPRTPCQELARPLGLPSRAQKVLLPSQILARSNSNATP